MDPESGTDGHSHLRRRKPQHELAQELREYHSWETEKPRKKHITHYPVGGEPYRERVRREDPHRDHVNLRNPRRTHLSFRGRDDFKLSHYTRPPPVARNWGKSRKRITAVAACVNTFLMGYLIGVYVSLQRHVVDTVLTLYRLVRYQAYSISL